MRSRFLHVVTALAMLLAIWAVAPGCGRDEAVDAPTETAAPPPPRPVAVLTVENFGEIRIELLPDIAPATVENFIKLAEEGFYDGTTFHRVIPEFMIQGGDPNTNNRDPRDDGKGGPGYTIKDEFSKVSHVRGVISMANSSIANSGGSQFFITVKHRPHLDGYYALFGKVLEGIEVADRISTVERDLYGRYGPRDRPLENVVLSSVRIERPESAPNPASRPKAEVTSEEWDEGEPES
jgi:peptidyl-prolyl cis-trans isomerase B (cyclophilin B)